MDHVLSFPVLPNANSVIAPVQYSVPPNSHATNQFVQNLLVNPSAAFPNFGTPAPISNGGSPVGQTLFGRIRGFFQNGA